MDLTEFKRRFGLKLKSLREHKGITQDDLAAKLELSQDTISNIERGATIPRIATAAMLAEAYGVPIDELFRLDDTVDLSREHQLAIAEVVAQLREYDVEKIKTISKVLQVAFPKRRKRSRTKNKSASPSAA